MWNPYSFKNKGPALKHSLYLLNYGNKRKTFGGYDLKIKIKIYHLKIIHEWIFLLQYIFMKIPFNY